MKKKKKIYTQLVLITLKLNQIFTFNNQVQCKQP